MNFRVLFKSIRFAFRAKKRVITFIMIYAFLIVMVSRGLMVGGDELLWIFAAFVLATLYAILIAQSRSKDIAILKCVSWNNSDIFLLLVGEVVLVSLAAFLLVFQVSVEIMGLVAYFQPLFGVDLLVWLQANLAVEVTPLLVTLFVIVILQLPGLFLAQRRAMMIAPMRALREE
ncbi:MAG: hypothetical protein EAX95_06160 [Candidatus Thorarchaeota archaeon]|nr:hypothetical protein [Candidatus Thorarchaeota archaeon]